MHNFAPVGLFILSLAPCLCGAEASGRQWDYPSAPRGNVVDDYHGAAVADPFRDLEDLDSPRTQAWVQAENKLAFGFLGTLSQRAWFHDCLTRLWNYPRYGLPFKEGGHYFFTKNDGLQNQPVLYVQAEIGSPPQILLDPNGLSKDGTVALAASAVSHDGKWLAYATATAGSDWNDVRVRDIATGRDTADLIQWLKFSELSWTRDSKGFFYSRFPEPKTVDGSGATFGELSHQKIYYHRLGTRQSEDRLIFQIPNEPLWLMGAEVTEDGRYAIMTIGRGDSDNTLVRLVDLGDPESPRLGAPATTLIDAWDAEYTVIGNDGPVLFVQTNRDAPRKRIVAIDSRAPEPSHWKTIVPEGADTIDSSRLIGGKCVVLTMHDASSRLLVYAKDGRLLGRIPLPEIGTVEAVTGHDDDPEFFYNYTSFTTPAINFRHNLDTGENRVFQAPELHFNPADYQTKQVFYTSKDGTRVPMFITHKKGLVLDSAAPTLLYGYGGFDIPETPQFSLTALAWLEMGGVYAVPNLRGGGEYGRGWHEAGTKDRKQNVFNDFIAAADWLFANHYTSPARLVISGASNGGLLIGATLNQRPDLCRVALPDVGVMDMLRFQKFTIGWAWVSDYGSSDDPAAFKYLYAYSPLHNVRASVRYPAVFVTTADHDDRVYPGHSFKYVATMQAAVDDGPGALPVMIRIGIRAGHGAGKPVSKKIDEAADKLAFAAHFLGIEPEKP